MLAFKNSTLYVCTAAPPWEGCWYDDVNERLHYLLVTARHLDIGNSGAMHQGRPEPYRVEGHRRHGAPRAPPVALLGLFLGLVNALWLGVMFLH